MKNYYGYIYITTNLFNNKIYIGQSRRNEKKFKNYFGSGLHLKNAINKYGKHNFYKRIIGYCNSQEELDKCEIECIYFYRSYGSDGEN